VSEDPILAALARLEGGQTAMRADITTFRAEASGFREQVLNRLTAIREDISVNMARVDRVAETATDIRAELISLRVENTALWRMIKALETRVEHIEAPGQ
jgi:hypothetical protein